MKKKNLIEINIILTDDESLLRINKEFLNHDNYTDTITFPYNEKPKDVWGDIYISIDRIKDNAKTYKVKMRKELINIMIHGVLHLCGYEDKHAEEEKDIMFEKQAKYLKKYYNSFHVEQTSKK